MNRLARLLAAPCLFALSSVVVAADAKDPQPLMTVRGKQVLADDFSGPSVDPKWKAAKGKWEVVDGALKGVELASDMHPAAIHTPVKLADGVFQFDFRLDGAKTTHLSLNAAKGHVCRVTITPAGFQVRKDGSKTDEADKGVLLDSCKMPFEKGKWYTMLVEVSGKEILARVDDRHFAFGADEKVATAKAMLGFPVAGDAACFDNVKVWEATPNPDWAKTKERLAAEHPEKLAPARPGAAKKEAADAK
jgi:hypothetical protein